MKITSHIHCLRIDFQVTPEIRRFVHVFFIMGEKIYMIDAGVAGSEQIVSDYLSSMNRSIKEIDRIFLTHSHPDHTGGAAAIKRMSGCKIYASKTEKEWIEDIEQQFKERPIPNFHTLLNESVNIDVFIRNGDVIACEEGISMQVLDTPGHSLGSQCFLFQQEQALFTGDAIPVSGDIPIYVSATQLENSLKKLIAQDNVALYLSAWDEIKNTVAGQQTLLLALEKQSIIDKVVLQVIQSHPNAPLDIQFKEVCRILKLEKLEHIPPFRQSLSAHLQEAKAHS
ncbi:MAG: MBL fold metallo-hydrolase [Akkermansia sp.]